MKVRPSVKKMCEKCKIIKEKVVLWLFAITLNTNKDKVSRRYKWQEFKVSTYQMTNV